MFDKYVELAQKKQSLTQNGVAKKIGITSACMSFYVSGKKLPSEETILKVAALAGVAPERALIDLNLWRSKDSPNRHEVWKKLSKMIQFSIALCICFNTLQLESYIPDSTHKMYLMSTYLFLFCFVTIIYKTLIKSKYFINKTSNI